MNKQQNLLAKYKGSKCKVYHRSDLLMEEQMQLVHQVQAQLKNALQHLETEKDPVHIQQLRLDVADLQAQSQKHILALKVMDKLNTELIYARAELKEAICQSPDKVNLSRKRVIWLEDKMGELCGKKKLKGLEAITHPKSNETVKEEIHQEHSQTPDQGEDIEHVMLKNMDLQEGSEQDSKSYLNEKETDDKNDDRDITNNLSSTTATENDFQLSTESKTENCESLLEEESIKVENGSFAECFDEELMISPKLEQSHYEQVYLTEVQEQTEECIKEGGTSDYSTEHETDYNVTIKAEIQVKEQPRDLASEYWQSEHHRFEYSQLANQILEADPLSYHQVGLAVPGSFIQKEDIDHEFKALPWRARRKESEIKDVHRVALDKLAARIHGLHYKVYDASQLSVRSWNKHHDSENKTEPESYIQMPKDKTATEMSTNDNKINGHQEISYLKLKRQPSILPITRTSWSKEYPRFASSFCKPDPESREVAQRIVDQRNLIEETKLVLYADKSKRSIPGAAHLEKKFQKMIATDEGSKKNKIAEKKLQTSVKAAVALSRLQSGANKWNQIKPESRGKEFSGLRWERVKTIVHFYLQSLRVEERIDGARQLGILRCGDTMVTYALKERIKNDPEERVQYEAAKALILIGCWDEEVVECVLKYLVLGNQEMRTDLIQTISRGKNVQFVNKTMPSVIELAKVLSHFCQNPDPDDMNAFYSAVCLGQMCIKDQHGQDRLIQTLTESQDTHLKAKALEILVKQLHYTDDLVVQHIEDMLRDSPVWAYRALACNLLISLGPKHKCVVKHNEKIYQLLERRLWDDPSMEVRLTAAKSLTALGMFSRACDSVVLKLEDLEEEKRAQAAIAVGTLGLKNEKVIRLLLEMLELDLSDYVRLMIIRTFRILKLTDRRVIRSLKDKERLEGTIGRECEKALKVLDSLTGQT